MARLTLPQWRKCNSQPSFSVRLVNAVAIAGSPVAVMAVPVMGIRRAGILATMRSCVPSPAIVRTACRRMPRRAVGSRVCTCPIPGSACISGRQRYHDAKQGQHCGNSFHGLSAPFFRDAIVTADSTWQGDLQTIFAPVPAFAIKPSWSDEKRHCLGPPTDSAVLQMRG